MTESNTQRIIKREIHGKPHKIRISPAPGWQDVLLAEIQRVLLSWSLPSKFSTELHVCEDGIELWQLDFRNMIELPLRLLTAADIRWSIRSRHVGSFSELSHFLETVPWNLYLPSQARIHIKVASYRSKLFHEGKIAEVISQHLQEKGFELVREGPAYRLSFEQIENRHEVWLSLTQEPLFHRNYKAAAAHRAPLQEHLAAAAIRWFFSLQQQSNWTVDQCYVPFAGSGTLWAEAVLYLWQLSPHHWRPSFGFESWPSFTKASWNQIIKKRIAESERSRCCFRSVLIDRDPVLAEALKTHISRFLEGDFEMGLGLEAEAKSGDFFDSSLPFVDRPIFMPLNPPYGLRLEQSDGEKTYEDAAKFYQRLGGKIGLWLREGRDIRGFVLVPDYESFLAFRSALGESNLLAGHSFTQGGQHIRCVAFGSSQ